MKKVTYDTCVVLKAASLSSHIRIIAAVLGHFDLPLVIGGVSHGDAHGCRVGGRLTQVNVC